MLFNNLEVIKDTYYGSFTNQVNKGKVSEDTFKKVAKKNGYIVKKTTDKQNRMNHIDFILTKNNDYLTVDVKTVGKYGFTGELQNNYGYPGSIYGDASQIAYVDIYKNIIYIYNRTDIVDLIEKKVDMTIPVENVDAHGPCKYRRFNRTLWKDVWVILDHNDLDKLPKIEWKIEL
jgi:hypothetical protein